MKRVLVLAGVCLLLAGVAGAAEGPVSPWSVLFGGSASYSQENPGSIKMLVASVKAAPFVATRLAVGPELTYTNVEQNSVSANTFQGGVFAEFFIGKKTGRTFGKIGVGVHGYSGSNRSSGIVYNPRVGLVLLFTEKAAVEIEMGYMKLKYNDSAITTSPDKTYLSVGLLGFAY